jgi:hypothetical protein
LEKNILRKYNSHFKLLDTFIIVLQIYLNQLMLLTIKCFERWEIRAERINIQNGILGTSLHKMDTSKTLPTFLNVYKIVKETNNKRLR